MVSLEKIFNYLNDKRYDDLIKILNQALSNDDTNPLYYYYRFLAYNEDYINMDFSNAKDEIDLNKVKELTNGAKYLDEYQFFKILPKELLKLFVYANHMNESLYEYTKNNIREWFNILDEKNLRLLKIYLIGLEYKFQIRFTIDIINLLLPNKESYNSYEAYAINDIKSLLQYLNSKEVYTKDFVFEDDVKKETINEALTLDIKNRVLCTAYDKKVKELSIPSYVKKIDSMVFFDFTNLEKVTLPKDLEEIGNYAFKYCTNLKEIEIPKYVYNIGFGAFENCWSLENVVLSNSISIIRRDTFLNCSKLSSINIPFGVVRICSNAFAKCINLTEVYLSASVREIEPNAFYMCSKLKKIYYNKALLRLVRTLKSDTNYKDVEFIEK